MTEEKQPELNDLPAVRMSRSQLERLRGLVGQISRPVVEISRQTKFIDRLTLSVLGPLVRFAGRLRDQRAKEH